jgi:hypothetical protein
MDEVINRFNQHGVRYLLIGGQAVRLEGLPRFSMDWDFYIPPHDVENIAQINQLLAEELDLPLLPLGRQGENFVQTYQTRWGILQFHLGGAGLPPFDDAERRLVRHRTELGTEVRCLAGPDLLISKRAAGRPQDQEDVRFLERKAAMQGGRSAT